MAKDTSDFIIHVNPIRLFVKGEGNLMLTLFSLDDVASESLRDVAMLSATDKATDVLSNFKSQYAAIEGQITEISEYFIIRTITPFIKPSAASYPVL